MPKKLNKKQLDILLTNIASAPPSHRDQVLAYAIKYLSLLNGPLTDHDLWEAALIGRQKILHDKGIPREMYDLRDDLYRSLRAERHPTHELAEVPSYREPMADGDGQPAKIIEHEPVAVEPMPVAAEPTPARKPEPADSDAEVSRAFHIGAFLQHIARFG